MPDEGTPIHCHGCGHLAAVEDGACSNCGAPRERYSTPAESGARFRSIVDRLTGGGDGR